MQILEQEEFYKKIYSIKTFKNQKYLNVGNRQFILLDDKAPDDAPYKYISVKKAYEECRTAKSFSGYVVARRTKRKAALKKVHENFQ